ncbi:hypothetical protein EG68_09083 [Paragonimus skrjabini miyazakii]|uniref:Uncharacterized protein n=1 Tax=Paragonimus skrjabini miyazakii TaxID=59628 RepID=A0A8S9YUU3_9TREM|nr:hypothetical protein EG68_09083 [Paragonimus skrjabini miyazakii]
MLIVCHNHKDFVNATCNALVRIREKIHGLRLDINALRYHISPALSGESAGYPVKFPMDTVEVFQLLNAKLEDITLRNTLVNDRFVTFTYTNYLKLIGGGSVGIGTRNILGTLMTDELANSINWRRVNDEFCLASTPLANVIIDKPFSN